MLYPNGLRRGIDPSPYILVRQTAPSVEPITKDEVKEQAVIGTSEDPVTEDDDLLDGFIAAVTAHLDGATGWLGRCLVEQTWDMKLDWFPTNNRPIHIPLPPLRSIEQITYVDENGSTQTLASSVYQVAGVDAHMGGYLVEAYEQSWPATRDIPEAITIRFKAGYAPTADSPPDYRANVPEVIKRAMMIMVADLYAQRETFGEGERVPMSISAMSMLSPFRTRWFA